MVKSRGDLMKVRLTKEQINKRNWLIEQLGDKFKEIDLPLVESLAFAIDRLEYMDSQINDINSLLSDKVYMASRAKFVTQVENGLKMLDITPQARNKANSEAIATANNTDPLEALLDV